MKNKLVKDMTIEEIVKELDLIARDGEDKFRIKNLSEKQDNKQTVTVEKDEYIVTVETSINDNVEIEVHEETDAEFGRRVRFSIKIDEFRKKQARIAEQEARKPKIVRMFNEFKREFNKAGVKALDRIEERLGMTKEELKELNK